MARDTRYNRTIHKYFHEVLRRCPDLEEYNALKSIMVEVASKERKRVKAILKERMRSGKKNCISRENN